MRNALHERLEYLLTYSSQLIFISSDSLSQQQRSLENFVFHQPDDTDIAMITASAEMNASDYRRQICRQLNGSLVGSYVRPLNTLLALQTPPSTPLLIAIIQAQHLPRELLQELWQLVQESRQPTQKRHLNVLLFGESQWANDAKQWLPSVNTDKPLLISSQSVETPAFDGQTQLAVAKRREQFQQYLQQHTRPTTLQHKQQLLLMLFVTLALTALGWWWFSDTTPPLTDTNDASDLGELPLLDPPAVLGTGLARLYPDISSAPVTSITEDAALSAIPPPEVSVNASEPVPMAEPEVEAEQAPPNTIETTLFDLPLLSSPQENHYYIQLARMQNAATIFTFVAERQLKDDVLIYPSQQNESLFYVLVYARSFPNRQAALDALPEVRLRTGVDGAFIKPAQRIASEQTSVLLQ